FVLRLPLARGPGWGPFALFRGVDGTLLILAGGGVVLRRAGAPEVVLERGRAPFPFPGEMAYQCELVEGPVRDFNLMVDRASAEATLDVVRLVAWGAFRLVAGRWWLYGWEGQVEVAGERLAPEELLEVDGPGIMRAGDGAGARVLAIHFIPRG
ncbi:MAG: HutD family protein, partial [Cystobacter sp.]